MRKFYDVVTGKVSYSYYEMIKPELLHSFVFHCHCGGSTWIPIITYNNITTDINGNIIETTLPCRCGNLFYLPVISLF